MTHARMTESTERIRALRDNVQRVFLGSREAVDHLICCVLGRGHVLIEDVPPLQTLTDPAARQDFHGAATRLASGSTTIGGIIKESSRRMGIKVAAINEAPAVAATDFPPTGTSFADARERDFSFVEEYYICDGRWAGFIPLTGSQFPARRSCSAAL